MTSRSGQQGQNAASTSSHKTPFFQQRDALINEIAVSLEDVLQNINKLNRSLEGVIAVGNEFGAVEALWSQFEGVMAQALQEGEGKDAEEKDGESEDADDGEEDDKDGR